jgi:glutathione S-transferase
MGTPANARVAVEQWLMWQMGGVGPMAGQAHHFLKYAPALDPPQDLPYAKDRYRREVGRLYGVLDRQLADKTPCRGRFPVGRRFRDLALGAGLGNGRNRRWTTSPISRARQPMSRRQKPPGQSIASTIA